MAPHDHGSGLASSLTDLMTSLAVIFILLFVASHNNKQQTLNTALHDVETMQKELDTLREQTRLTRSRLLLKLKETLATFADQHTSAEQHISIEEDRQDPLGLLIIVPEGLLNFAFDKAEMPQKGMAFLREFAPRLAQTACAEEFQDEIHSIVIEGHTDSSGTDKRNLPLSQQRSMTVVQESLDILSAEDSTTSLRLRPCFLHLLSASGRGSSELFLVEGKEDRDRSRRVVFKIRVRSLEQRHVVTLTQPVHRP